MSQVAVIRCESYEIEEVRRAVTRGLDLLGGAGAFAGPKTRLLLKPNLLVGEDPDKCVNTHPSVFRAVAEIFLAAGATVSYGDSPAVGSTSGAAKKAGLKSVADDLGVGEADFRTPVEHYFEKGEQNRKFIIAGAVTENDVIVSLPKMKTHGFEKFTGAVKNQFGCVPGIRKGEYHIKLPDPDGFARMLLDLNALVNPALYVMDGVVAMEGNGPRGGRPRPMNVILFSRDPIAMDATACRLIGLDPELVPTVRIGSASGRGTSREDEIELLGDGLKGLIRPDFDVDRSPLRPYRTRGIMRFIANRLVPRPAIVRDRCVLCGLCVELCPTVPKSVDWRGDDRSAPPGYDYSSCIRCYCCQEICPEGAIELEVPLLRRLFGKKRAVSTGHGSGRPINR
ncbi:MAG: DUF362 domain-containing protein [Chrysiogenales bacterium]|nr:MAG: DUF362 domain-containing protein [Chrysiogenales bacterium]